MNLPLHISKFCMIRNNKVVVDHDLLYGLQGSAAQEFFKKVYKHFNIGYPKFYKMDNLCKLGFLAAELLLKNRNVNRQYGKDKTGMILANAASSLETDKNYQISIADRNNYFPSPAVFVYTLPNIVLGEISIRHKLFGENTFFLQEKFDPGFMHFYVRHLFENNLVSCCITGWIEVDADHYETVLYLVEKTGKRNNGIAIFDVESMERIYCMKI